MVCPKWIRQVVQLAEFHTLGRVCYWRRYRPRHTKIALWLCRRLKLSHPWWLWVIRLPLRLKQGFAVCTVASSIHSLGCTSRLSTGTVNLSPRGSSHLDAAHLRAKVRQVYHIQHVLKALCLALYKREEFGITRIRYGKLRNTPCRGQMQCALFYVCLWTRQEVASCRMINDSCLL